MEGEQGGRGKEGEDEEEKETLHPVTKAFLQMDIAQKNLNQGYFLIPVFFR